MPAIKRYRLYIDESGDHTFYDTDEPGKRYLGLLGLMINTEHYRTTMQPNLEALKQRHFPHSPDEPVILHRKDIINKSGPFWRLRDPGNETAFNTDFLEYCLNHEYRVIAVVIDKKTHSERYREAALHPYHYCLVALLERYCGLLNLRGHQGDVMAESRGGTEDRQLKEAYHAVYRAGTQWRGRSFFQRALTSGQIKLKPKSSNIAGLQFADLLAHPVKQAILLEKGRIDDSGDNFGRQLCECLVEKYNRQVYNGRVWGYGKVFLG